MKNITYLILMGLALPGLSQKLPTTEVNDVNDQRQTTIALTHATVHVSSDQTFKDVALIIENGHIIAINKDNSVPENAVVKDYTGMHIYPGFINLDATVGLPEPAKRPPFSWGGKETLASTTGGAYNANEAIKASYQAADHFKLDAEGNAALRAAGFTSALIHQKDGIMRGSGALVSLADDDEQLTLLAPQASQHYSFDKGSSKQDYPVSLMGAVALLRQTWLDADWYQKQDKMVDLDLAAIKQTTDLPRIFEVKNWQQLLLTKKLADEFGLDFVVKTDGDSYQSIKAVAATKETLIVPLSFPQAPAVESPLDSYHIDYVDLKKWQVAPFNAALLEQNGVRFALLPSPEKNGLKEFLKDLNKAVEHGLSEATAMAALTSIPAAILKRQDLGHLNPGARADFIVLPQALFTQDSEVYETWVGGKINSLKPLPAHIEGHYTLQLNQQNYDVLIQQKGNKLTLKSKNDKADDDKGKGDKDSPKFHINLDGQLLTIRVNDESSVMAWVKAGQIQPITEPQNWSISKIENTESNQNKEDEADKIVKEMPNIPVPFLAYGLADTTTPDKVLFQNASVWTNEEAGILEQTDVLVVAGRIAAVAKNIATSRADLVIDASGKHLTSGIIDEHSHIALLSVNDVAVNSSMVRMADVVNPQDINIYRNLAGGVTAAQLLHGSANPIGGQSALIKMRWGVTPDELLIAGADGFIKFALGENVKRSRNEQSIRYPLTRMGVEQVYRDAFSEAVNYQQQWQDYNDLSRSKKKNTSPPRRDLAMEATAEVVNESLFISCHSYVQSEISMLIDVADDYDFNVNTFTHILEGYKVADKMLKHGAGASTFADWWAYKWEVNEAIPYNAAIMDKVGLVTAINSDSAEMSRRLNQEAAKTIKYGGLTEQQAWKTVTLNPAKLLHLDSHMGSIKVGKDADLVLWSDKPLSIYAKAEKTMVDGVIYFDRDKQADLEQRIADEKLLLIKQSRASDEPKSKTPTAPMPEMHCDTLLTENTGFQLN